MIASYIEVMFATVGFVVAVALTIRLINGTIDAVQKSLIRRAERDRVERRDKLDARFAEARRHSEYTRLRLQALLNEVKIVETEQELARASDRDDVRRAIRSHEPATDEPTAL